MRENYPLNDFLADKDYELKRKSKLADHIACSHWEPVKENELPMIEVISDMRKRFKFGLEKYGKPCKPYDGEDYLQHAYEEAMDLCVYLKTAMLEREKKKCG